MRQKDLWYSACANGDNKPWEWPGSVGHLWRTTGDITSCWIVLIHTAANIIRGSDVHTRHAGQSPKIRGTGHWNDPDMLEVGNGSLTLTESRAHFSLWAMLAAPLIAGNDLRKVSKDVLNILTDKEVISIDQDSLGIQAFSSKQNRQSGNLVQASEKRRLGFCAFLIAVQTRRR